MVRSSCKVQVLMDPDLEDLNVRMHCKVQVLLDPDLEDLNVHIVHAHWDSLQARQGADPRDKLTLQYQ